MNEEIIGKLYKADYTNNLYVIPTKVMAKGKHYVYGILINFIADNYGLDMIFPYTQVTPREKFLGDFEPSKDYRKIFPLVFRLKFNYDK
jgi:hypothetical protein